jgi:hypothetical protein
MKYQGPSAQGTVNEKPRGVARAPFLVKSDNFIASDVTDFRERDSEFHLKNRVSFEHCHFTVTGAPNSLVSNCFSDFYRLFSDICASRNVSRNFDGFAFPTESELRSYFEFVTMYYTVAKIFHEICDVGDISMTGGEPTLSSYSTKLTGTLRAIGARKSQMQNGLSQLFLPEELRLMIDGFFGVKSIPHGSGLNRFAFYGILLDLDGFLFSDYEFQSLPNNPATYRGQPDIPAPFDRLPDYNKDCLRPDMVMCIPPCSDYEILRFRELLAYLHNITSFGISRFRDIQMLMVRVLPNWRIGNHEYGIKAIPSLVNMFEVAWNNIPVVCSEVVPSIKFDDMESCYVKQVTSQIMVVGSAGLQPTNYNVLLGCRTHVVDINPRVPGRLDTLEFRFVNELELDYFRDNAVGDDYVFFDSTPIFRFRFDENLKIRSSKASKQQRNAARVSSERDGTILNAGGENIDGSTGPTQLDTNEQKFTNSVVKVVFPGLVSRLPHSHQLRNKVADVVFHLDGRGMPVLQHLTSDKLYGDRRFFLDRTIQVAYNVVRRDQETYLIDYSMAVQVVRAGMSLILGEKDVRDIKSYSLVVSDNK